MMSTALISSIMRFGTSVVPCDLVRQADEGFQLNLIQWGRFFIASERSDRSSPVCLSFFYSSERFVLRFLMTD